MKRALPLLARALRRPITNDKGKVIAYERTFQYAAVWELHKSGFPHVHLASWGDYIPWQEILTTWRQLTGATHIWIAKISDNETPNHSWSKYITSAIPTRASIFNGLRRVQFSRNYDRFKTTEHKQDTEPDMQWYYIPAHPETIASYLVAVLLAIPLSHSNNHTFLLRGLSPAAGDPFYPSIPAIENHMLTHSIACLHNDTTKPP